MVKNMEDIYRSFYTKSVPIVHYMLSCLKAQPDDTVLEPCAGDGVFIDAIIKNEANQKIDAYEIDHRAYKILTEKYRHRKNISITLSDALFDGNLDFSPGYDRIIANPPYGAWQDFQRRRLLKKIYKNLYVKESYALFLYRAVHLLKDKGILVFIIPDTFLYLHTHRYLRYVLLQHTKIKELALFPSKFFPGISFGYANLCILTAERCQNITEIEKNEIKILTNLRKPEDLISLPSECPVYRQKDIINSLDHAFFISERDEVRSLLNNSVIRIGDIADCVTGMYSGNDKKYLRVLSGDVRNAKKAVHANSVNNSYLIENNILSGLTDGRPFIPIIKGGNTKYIKQNNCFIDWSKEAVEHYKSDKKARFQNSQYYFKEGIAVPMVSSKQMTASLTEKRIFDQSIVGIFPEEKYIYYLLAFFNSPTCNQLIRTINPSANNSANYIKKIPFIKPSDNMLAEVENITKKIVCDLKTGNCFDTDDEKKLNSIFKNLYKF